MIIYNVVFKDVSPPTVNLLNVMWKYEDKDRGLELFILSKFPTWNEKWLKVFPFHSENVNTHNLKGILLLFLSKYSRYTTGTQCLVRLSYHMISNEKERNLVTSNNFLTVSHLKLEKFFLSFFFHFSLEKRWSQSETFQNCGL